MSSDIWCCVDDWVRHYAEEDPNAFIFKDWTVKEWLLVEWLTFRRGHDLSKRREPFFRQQCITSQNTSFLNKVSVRTPNIAKCTPPPPIFSGYWHVHIYFRHNGLVARTAVIVSVCSVWLSALTQIEKQCVLYEVGNVDILFRLTVTWLRRLISGSDHNEFRSWATAYDICGWADLHYGIFFLNWTIPVVCI